MTARSTPDVEPKRDATTGVDAHGPEIATRFGGRANWAVIFGFWTLITLLTASQRYLALLRYEEYRITWPAAFAWQAPGWYLWALFTPVILWLGRHAPLELRRWRRALAVHLPTGIVLTLAYISLNVGALRMVQADKASEPVGEMFAGMLFSYLHVNLLLYGAVLGVGHAIEYYRRYRDHEIHASRLETQLAQARLQALHMQLNPHFLFNALHAIATLVRKGQDREAVRTIAELSDLLRHTLDGSETQEVRLEEELDFLRRYLEIESVRFGDRLRVRLDIAPELLEAHVPNLVLQPLVENAIKHGIGQRAAAGAVEIAARRVRDVLELRVADDGPGLPPGWSIDRAGIGLANTAERLRRLYGDRQRLELAAGTDGGAVATVALPFRIAAAAPETAR